ncbi:uncharacterized protein [Miscanthus floridulus]|uniref:uncharacterized protein n=1 Tax=Miscanthus floridulus TaxID=154761 RepID=UPI00345B4885
MAAAPLPTTIILALGAAALGGPDALRVLLEFTGRSPCLDVAICLFVMFMVTAYLLGAALLVRFVLDARPGDAAGGGGAQRHGAAAATDCLAQVSLLVSVCLGFVVAACLVALPSVPSGGLGTLSFLMYFDGKTSFIAVAVAVTVAVIAAAAATAVRRARPVVRFVRGAGNPDDGAPGARFSRTRQMVCFIIALLLAAVSSAASGGLDAKLIFPGFPCQNPITNVPVGVAVATVAGTALVVRFSRRVRNAAGAAARPTPATGTWRRRFGKLTSLAVVAGLLAMAYAHSQSGSEADGGEHVNSA